MDDLLKQNQKEIEYCLDLYYKNNGVETQKGQDFGLEMTYYKDVINSENFKGHSVLVPMNKLLSPF